MGTIETKLVGQGVRIGVVVARFNHLITRRLLEGCELRLRELGCQEADVMWVPGAFCVITTDTVEQALARAAAPGEPGVNKGVEAVEVAVEMTSLLAALEKGP